MNINDQKRGNYRVLQSNKVVPTAACIFMDLFEKNNALFNLEKCQLNKCLLSYSPYVLTLQVDKVTFNHRRSQLHQINILLNVDYG